MFRRSWVSVIYSILWIGLFNIGFNFIPAELYAEESKPISYRVKFQYYTMPARTLKLFKDWEWNVIRNGIDSLDHPEKVEPLDTTAPAASGTVQANCENLQFDTVFLSCRQSVRNQ